MHYQEHCFQLTAIEAIRFYMHLAKLLLAVTDVTLPKLLTVSWFCPCKLGAIMSFFYYCSK